MRTFKNSGGEKLEFCADVIRAAYAVGGTVYGGARLEAHTEAYKTVIVIDAADVYIEVE